MITFLNIFVGVCMFIIGTLFGSFFSLAFYRIPKCEDIVIKNSYCPNCKHNLNFSDLIPIISFCIRGGKCKYCKEKISLRYPMFELFNGLVFLALYSIIGYNLKLLSYIIIYIVLFFIIGVIISKYRTNLKNNSKKGIFLTELIVAIIFFSIVLTSMYIVVRNNVNRSNITIAKANALSLAVKNIEVAKLTEYDILSSFSNDESIDNVNYHVEVKVSKISDEDSTKQDIVKKITTTVTYSVNGREYDFSINTVKGKVL